MTEPGRPSPSLTDRLTDEIRRSARQARSEEDFKMGVEQALAPLRAELGITPSYETTYPSSVSVLGGGSSDAVYGHAVIEYKKPGRLGTPAGRREATSELEKYLLGEAGKYGSAWEPALRRMIGVALDGERLFFLRYRGDRKTPSLTMTGIPTHQMSLFKFDEAESPGFQVIGPFPVDADSVGLLVVYLRALRRRALTPEALALEFGPAGDIARRLVPAFYRRVSTAIAGIEHLPRVQTLFAEWDRLFGIVYGQDIEKTRRDAGYLSSLYGMTGAADLKPLLFAVHTYYALLMKLLAAELASLQGGALVSSPLAGVLAMSRHELKDRLTDLEDGGLFARVGIHNFLEGDFFGWYLSAWIPEFDAPIRDLARSLAEYEPATGSILPEATRDLLKKLYQYLVPKQLRHDLGEYYTPDWLAELTIDESKYQGELGKRFLDPACGSGTFLVLAIRRAREWADENLIDPDVLAAQILKNIVGFDLNPLAVIAARTNYLLALGTLIRRLPSVEIPVYLCDSVLTPSRDAMPGEQTEAFYRDFELPSTVGPFTVPRAIVAGGLLATMANLLEDCVRLAYSPDEFAQRARTSLGELDSHAHDSLRLLYEKLLGLEREGRDGLWARLLKNAFAPLFAGEFDFVIGNPPWIRWTYLADSYRAATLPMWTRYGLFSLTGIAARLGSGEKDFSMLFTYAAADHYLKDGGTLGFVITQEVLKGKGAGEGFRRFRLGQQGPYLGLVVAHDLVTVKPFEGAANKTAVIVLRKGIETTYPVPYFLWRRHRGVGSIPTDATLRHTLTLTDRAVLAARPIGTLATGAWQTSPLAAADALARLRGSPEYVARRGAGTDPYGVFWLRVIEARPDGTVLVQNRPELGDRDIRLIDPTTMESTLIHPAIRGADIRRWFARPEVDVLIAQDPATRKPYPSSDLKIRLPQTYRYLNGFRAELLSRGSNTVRELAERTEPWAMFGIGEYTFAPYRVTWKRMAGLVSLELV